MSKEELLKALERLKTAPTFMGGTPEYKACTKSETLLMQDYEIVKQFILKAQEPKQYLKWEDLEFEDFPKEIEVRIGDNICKLEYRVSMLGNKTVILMGNNKIYLQLFENNIQFFNDLHLERVEE